MDRRLFILLLCAGVGIGGAAFAATFEDSVVAQLRAQGYSQIVQEHTLLGRVRIVGYLGGNQREIILNPRTGEVLRDVLVASDGSVMPEIAGTPSSGGSDGNSGSGSSDGSGSDGSGSGSSGSDGGGSDGSGSGSSGSDGSGSGSSGSDGSGSGGGSDGSGDGSGGGGGSGGDGGNDK